MQAINTFHIRYVTSDKAEYEKLHPTDPHVLYVNRTSTQHGMSWDCSVLSGTRSTYAVATGNAEENDYVRACKGGPCACVTCRESTPHRPQFLNTDKSEDERCRCDDLTGGFQDYTLTYNKPSNLVAATKKELERSAERFAKSIKKGTALLLGVDGIKDGFSTKAEPYTVVLATCKPYVTTRMLKKDGGGDPMKGDGVGAQIPKNKLVVEFKYLKRVGPLSFAPWNWGKERTTVVRVESLIPVKVKLLSATVREGKKEKRGFRLPREDHERVMRRNLSRFSTFH